MATDGKWNQWVWAAMLALQLFMHFLSSEYVALFLPPLLAALPFGYLRLRSEKVGPVLRGYYALAGGAIIWGLAAFAVLVMSEQTLISIAVRALIVDLAVFYPISIFTYHLHVSRRNVGSAKC